MKPGMMFKVLIFLSEPAGTAQNVEGVYVQGLELGA